MKPYRSSNSGIEAVDHGDNWIQARFKGGKIFEYRSPPLTSYHITAMKQHADAEHGLNTYINTHRDVYEAGRPLS